MHIAHHPLFVALSVLTAWLGAWTALDLFRRVRVHSGGWRLGWLAATGIAMGLSIWSMHFIAMLGFDPGGEIRYDVGLTVLSLLLAITTTAFAFFFAQGQGIRREVIGGLVMGAGICTMHYVGMAAVITDAGLANDPVYVAFAFLVAVTASTSALFVARTETTVLQRVLAAAVLGFAIVGMHYTAMYGVRILPGPVSQVGSTGVDSLVLAMAVAAGTLFILLLALIAALSDRRFEALAVREASRSERQLRAILDNLPIGVFVAAAPSGEILFSNREAARLLGRSLEGETIWGQGEHGALDAQGQRLALEEHVLYQAMNEHRRIGPELRSYRRADGVLMQLEVTAAPIPDRASDGSLAVAAFQDVTAKLLAEEQAQQQRELQRVNELLEQRVAAALLEKAEVEAALLHAQRLESLGRLTGGVAHDFNNLLTVVIGALDVILRHPEEAGRRARLGTAALAAARRGERLTSQLLAFARRQPLQPEARDLNALIREYEPLLRRAASEEFSLQLRLCPERVVVRIDPAQFEATLLNLIVNAIDASPAGAEISVETSRRSLSRNEVSNLAPGEYFVLSVEDRGQGMTPEVISRVFEPFFTTKPVGKGTGLGLSQVYGFVKQSGGEIQVQSTVGHGTCFRIYLPISTAETQRAQQRRRGAADADQSLAVLLAEDDPAVGTVTEAMLIDLGHTVQRATNGEEALQILRSDTRFDVLFSDVVMPGGMTGVELARRALESRPQLKVLLTSGYAGEALDESLQQGAWPFLRKPYLASELGDALDALTTTGHSTRRQVQ